MSFVSSRPQCCCFPRVPGKQNLLFPAGPVIKYLLLTSNLPQSEYGVTGEFVQGRLHSVVKSIRVFLAVFFKPSHIIMPLWLEGKHVVSILFSTVFALWQCLVVAALRVFMDTLRSFQAPFLKLIDCNEFNRRGRIQGSTMAEIYAKKLNVNMLNDAVIY